MNEYGGNRRFMLDEIPGATDHRRIDATRPTLGFPLGTALILLIVFGVSALFSCCYHWEKIRNMHTRHSSFPSPSSHRETSSSDLRSATLASSTATFSKKQLKIESVSSLPVIMPGDQLPKFIARPSPHGLATHINIGERASAQSIDSKA